MWPCPKIENNLLFIAMRNHLLETYLWESPNDPF